MVLMQTPTPGSPSAPRLPKALQQLAAAMCIGDCLPKQTAEEDRGQAKGQHRRWYKIHPEGDLWHVRREAGPPQHVSADWAEVHEACGITCAGGVAAGGQVAAAAARSISALTGQGLDCQALKKGLAGSKEELPEQQQKERSISDTLAMMLRSPKGLDEAEAAHASAPVSPSGGLRRNLCSVPNFADRRLGLISQGFERDAFSNDCRVCFEQDCFSLAWFSKPAHKGGRRCPFCRTLIREALQLYRVPGEALQYAYTIDAMH
eukprot:TRINITY_DN21139_c0_g2_i1.p1 TRINITY_DN21139_c0_g2~~TRINITY_DN21139_c0_g2_i1.p1  ORF type:complete len:262 (+),score=56.44 TRINITY_DN21139_c0_g2_i1:105-890(+)